MIRVLQQQPLPQELGEWTKGSSHPDQSPNQTNAETRTEKLRRERAERASTEMAEFLDANGLTEYRGLFANFKRVTQLSRMTRATAVSAAAKRHPQFKDMKRAEHEQVAKIVKDGLAKLKSRGA